MQTQKKLSFFTLLLLISFASVNAVLFTPALPDITHYFSLSNDAAQHTISLFLIGYTLGQLLYGPIANRFGRKPAIYAGISIQIVSSLLCVLAGMVYEYKLLLVARFILALGSGVGLSMTFTLVNEYYEPQIASQKIAYLMLGFAIAPGLSVALGGILNTYFGWISCFYAGAFYGLILLVRVRKLPETNKFLNKEALNLTVLFRSYFVQFKNTRLLAGGLLMGSTTCFFYVFAAIAPFIAINLLNMSSAQYGIANILPPIGVMIGGIVSAKLAQRYSPKFIIRAGIVISSIGTLLMFVAIKINLAALFSLFFPMMIIYFGASFIFANTSSVAMHNLSDKAQASAVLSFVNMGWATLVILNIGIFPINRLLLPSICIILCGILIGMYLWLMKNKMWNIIYKT